MAINASKIEGKGKKFLQPVIETGVYPGRLVQVIDLGLQPQRPYQGKDKPPAYELMNTYELVDTFMVDEDGNEMENKPRWISETFPLNNLKAEKAKSTQRYMALDPTVEFGGDFGAVVGAPVNITIINNEKDGQTFANVAGLATMRPKDAAKCPPLRNEPKVFDLDNPDATVFGSLPEWIQVKIKGNLNYAGSKLQELLEGAAPKQEEKPAKKAQQEAPQEQEGEDQDRPW